MKFFIFSVIILVPIIECISAIDEISTENFDVTSTTLKSYINDGLRISTESNNVYNNRGIDTTTEKVQPNNEITSKTTEITTKKSSSEETGTISYEEEDYDDYETSDVCTIDIVIDYLSESLLPGDYEETKKLKPKYKVDHFNETVGIIKRLDQYSKNVSQIMEPIMKRLTTRMTDLLLMLDLPPDCMASLARIGQSVQDGEMWGLRCW